MLSSNEILEFVKNIYYAKDRRFDEEYAPMWVREISSTGASIADLHNAEIEIIRNNIPLQVSLVCDIVKSKMNLIKLEYKAKDCEYCKGKGIVFGVKFDKNGRYTKSQEYAINCVCGNYHIPNLMQMTEDKNSFHKTEVKDGYFRIFSDVTKKWEYLKRVEKNNNIDIMQ